MNAFLSLKHLEKVYPNGEKAVYDFNLDIDKNEFIVIVGPSGCGKSTTLRMIAGLEDITDGDLYLQDELLNYKPSNERKMAIVFQSYALYPQMNVYDNIAFPLTINKYSLPVVNTVLKAAAEITEALQHVEFKKFIGVLYNVFNSHSKQSQKEEQVATIFDISLYAAKLLCKIYDAYKQDELETVVNKEDEIRNAINAELKPLVEAENANAAEKGIKYNDEFCEVDGDGNVKTELRKYTAYEIKTRVYETAEKLDLIPYLDKLPKELSGGQMQRVALGRAIIKNVPIFLMDEPLSNLDAKLRLTMRSEIVKLHNRINATTIYVTHDQTEAMTMATRIVVMSRGFVQQIGAPDDIYNNPVNLFVAKFIGSPSMNIFEMDFDRETKRLECNDFGIDINDEFIVTHDKFYKDKIDLFNRYNENFDQKTREEILKIISITGETVERDKKKSGGKGLISKIKKLFEKKQGNIDPWSSEKDIAAEKLANLNRYICERHSLIVGIRPERIDVELYDPNKKYKNGFVISPTVCELLGGEYNIHFDFCGKDMVGRLDAKYKISLKDKIVVKFASEDLFVFDPVTGDTIR